MDSTASNFLFEDFIYLMPYWEQWIDECSIGVRFDSFTIELRGSLQHLPRTNYIQELISIGLRDGLLIKEEGGYYVKLTEKGRDRRCNAIKRSTGSSPQERLDLFRKYFNSDKYRAISPPRDTYSQNNTFSFTQAASVGTVEALPTELLQEIAGHMDFFSLKNFRLSSPTLASATEPVFFHDLVFDVHHNVESSIAFLEAIVSNTTEAARHVRRLHIKYLSPPQAEYADRFPLAFQDVQTKLEAFLPTVLERFRNLRLLSWSPGPFDPEWALHMIAAGLNSCKFFVALSVDISFKLGSPLPIHQLPPMERLSFECRSADVTEILSSSSPLSHLLTKSRKLEMLLLKTTRKGTRSAEISLGQRISHSSPIPLDYLSLISPGVLLDATMAIHCNRLSTLITDVQDVNSHPKASFWNAMRELKAASLRVLRVGANKESIEALLEFLVSFSGLEKLVIYVYDSPATFATFFYEHVLRAHAPTLTNLIIRPRCEGGWCFSSDKAAYLARCCRLSTLHVTVHSWIRFFPDPNSMERNAPMPFLFENVHCLLLTIAEKIPHLSVLHIDCADLPNGTDMIDDDVRSIFIHLCNDLVLEFVYESITSFIPAKCLPSSFSSLQVIARKRVFQFNSRSQRFLAATR